MCTTCGCGVGATRVADEELPETSGNVAGAAGDWHQHGDGHWHRHPHEPGQSPHEHASGEAGGLGDHGHHQRHGERNHHHHDHPAEPSEPAYAGAPPPTSAARLVEVERDLLAVNDAYAQENRRRFSEQGIFALNLVSSPGSGKTTLLCRTIELLKARLQIAVIEGDQQTSRDTERIRETGVPAIQINTGKGCHLDAHMVGHALHRLSPVDDSLLLVENVGNLVCPAAFDLGEAHKVVILSVTEGEDKPLKYPNMFHVASLMLLNKIDLLPHVEFNPELAVRYARQVNPALQVVQVSATTGEGLADWLAWLGEGCRRAREAKKVTVAGLRRRIAELEALLASGTRI